jgi:ketosteroid isomerase-like protein
MTLRHFELQNLLRICGLWLALVGTASAAVIDDIERDRPRIVRALDGRDAVRAWIEKHFSGGAIELHVRWDPAEPKSGRAAEHEYLTGRGPVEVRVSKHHSGLDQIAGLVFELHNMEGYRVFEKVYADAVTGKIGPEEFALRNLNQEFEARVATRKFLERHFGDVSRRDLRDHRLLDALLEPVPTPEAQLEAARKKGGDLREHYFKLFESDIVPERDLRTRISAFDAAFVRGDVDMLDEMLTERYRHTNAGSMPLTKSQWLGWIASRRSRMDEGRLKYDRYATEELDVVMTGDRAIVTGRNRAVGTKEGEEFTVDIRFTHVWVRNEGKWKRAAFHDAPAR